MGVLSSMGKVGLFLGVLRGGGVGLGFWWGLVV